MKMLHTCLRVYDLEASLEFYKMLGLVEKRRLDHSENGFILVYLTDSEDTYELELTYNIGNEQYELGNGYSHIALGTMDIEGDHQKHTELGHEVTPLKGLPGTPPSYYFITDPDGYKVEIININK
ncbi:VOC family protein [Mollicutes bacterium LVI A0039]|nr:VOC family protein [Mollicutes bacterium LVI A0039]